MREGSRLRAAVRAWCSSGAAAMWCSTFGVSEFIRLPMPAAKTMNETDICLFLFFCTRFTPDRRGRKGWFFTQGYRMKTVVFDLDGTLADTSADLLAAANACFVQLGHGVVLDQRDVLTAFHGGRAMLRAGFDRLGGGRIPRRIFRRSIRCCWRLMPMGLMCIPGCIRAQWRRWRLCGSQGYRTAICTNKPEGLAVELVRRLGDSQLFGALVGADTLPVRKPDPAPYVEVVRRVGGAVGRSMLIGDTETDRKTGLAAGVPVALVTFGPEGAGVARLEPEALLDRYEDLPGLVARLLD